MNSTLIFICKILLFLLTLFIGIFVFMRFATENKMLEAFCASAVVAYIFTTMNDKLVLIENPK
jgi:hypothetical protein